MQYIVWTRLPDVSLASWSYKLIPLPFTKTGHTVYKDSKKEKIEKFGEKEIFHPFSLWDRKQEQICFMSCGMIRRIDTSS